MKFNFKPISYFFLLNRGLGSPSTTDSKKSWGVMYICPSYSTDANLMKRFSRGVNFRFSETSAPLKNIKLKLRIIISLHNKEIIITHSNYNSHYLIVFTLMKKMFEE